MLRRMFRGAAVVLTARRVLLFHRDVYSRLIRRGFAAGEQGTSGSR